MFRMLTGVFDLRRGTSLARGVEINSYVRRIDPSQGVIRVSVFSDELPQFERFGFGAAAQVDQFVMAQDVAAAKARIGRECFIELKFVHLRNRAGREHVLKNGWINLRARFGGQARELAPVEFSDDRRLADLAAKAAEGERIAASRRDGVE